MSEASAHEGSSNRYSKGCRCDPCKEAMRVYQKAWREANRDHITSRNREYEKTHRQQRKAYDSTPERKARQAANKRRKYAEQRQVLLARVQAWQLANPDSRRVTRARRRALQASAETLKVTTRDWERLVRRHGSRCAYCFVMAPLTQDHVVPLARGGRHSIGNLLPACGPCNSSKNDRLLVEWRALLRSS